jgi:two-component system, chemotaxis family, chemotaxis protein CheY
MKHVLIIDDSSVIRKYARLIFESLNFRVSDTDSLSDALERTQSDTPDFILIDWIIPNANSLEFIATVRRANLERRCFVIYMVSENDAADIMKAFKAGADDYLLKPFNREIVEMKLHEIKVAA